MKKLLPILCITLIGFTCKEKYEYPVPSLIGVWVSLNPAMQLNIDNTTGKGEGITYLLKNDTVTIRNGEEVNHYKLRGLTVNEMVLKDTADIYFFRAK